MPTKYYKAVMTKRNFSYSFSVSISMLAEGYKVTIDMYLPGLAPNCLK